MEFELETSVTINETGASGSVVVVQKSLEQETLRHVEQYLVKFSDDQGVVHTGWFTAGELTAS